MLPKSATAKRKIALIQTAKQLNGCENIKEKVCLGFFCHCFHVLWHSIDKTCSPETNKRWRLRGVHYHTSWFITFPFPLPVQPSQVMAPTLPWPYLREAGLCSAHNFKAHGPLLFFPIYLLNAPLPLFVFSLSLFFALFNQYLFPLSAPFLALSLSSSISQHLFPFLFTPSFFLSPSSLFSESY